MNMTLSINGTPVAPTLVMALQEVIHKNIEKSLVADLEKHSRSAGPESPIVKAIQDLLNAKSSEVVQKCKAVFDKVASGEVHVAPLTLDEVTELAIQHGVNNRTIGDYRSRKAIDVAKMADGATEEEIGLALGLEGDEVSKLLGKLMTSGQLKKEGARFIAV